MPSATPTNVACDPLRAKPRRGAESSESPCIHRGVGGLAPDLDPLGAFAAACALAIETATSASPTGTEPGSRCCPMARSARRSTIRRASPVAGGPRSQDCVVALVAASRGNAAGEKKLAASVVQKGLAGRGGPEATR